MRDEPSKLMGRGGNRRAGHPYGTGTSVPRSATRVPVMIWAFKTPRLERGFVSQTMESSYWPQQPRRLGLEFGSCCTLPSNSPQPNRDCRRVVRVEIVGQIREEPPKGKRHCADQGSARQQAQLIIRGIACQTFAHFLHAPNHGSQQKQKKHQGRNPRFRRDLCKGVVGGIPRVRPAELGTVNVNEVPQSHTENRIFEGVSYRPAEQEYPPLCGFLGSRGHVT